MFEFCVSLSKRPCFTDFCSVCDADLPLGKLLAQTSILQKRPKPKVRSPAEGIFWKSLNGHILVFIISRKGLEFMLTCLKDKRPAWYMSWGSRNRENGQKVEEPLGKFYNAISSLVLRISRK